MARSINDIKNEITAEFMRNESAAELYGFELKSAFSDFFSPASIENILFYVWAVCAWAIEQLLTVHKSEISAQLDNQIVHRPKWYRDKVLAFMDGKSLIADSDVYDTSNMKDTEIKALQVVKHAVALESKDASLLIIKIAGESGGKRCPLTKEQEEHLKTYIAEIKDAGVRIDLVNMEADKFSCSVDIYYDPLLVPNEVKSACDAVIRDYIENLPFNGEYTNMTLVDRLQIVDGVKIVELIGSHTNVAKDVTPTIIKARYTPAAGYFEADNIQINMIAYECE